MRKLLLLALVLLAAGCSGSGDRTPRGIVRDAASRTADAGSARFDAQHRGGLRREGVLELDGDRARIVEHGEFGYREYRYLDGGWWQLGGELGPQGEDLAGKWTRHPSGGVGDVLAEYQQAIRSLDRADRVVDAGERVYRARVDGRRVIVRLDGRGRVRELRRPGLTIRLDDFGTAVDVEAPPPRDRYTGHS